MSTAPQTQQETAQAAPMFQPPKKKRKWLRRLIIIAVAAALIAGAVLLFGRQAAQTVSGDYLPAAVTRTDLIITVTGTGTVKPNDAYRATTLLRGEILTAPFEDGDLVEEDQVLFTLDPTDAENAIRQTEIALEQAKNSVERAETAVEQAEHGVTRAQTSVRQAELSVESAQLNYDSLLRQQQDNTADRRVKANASGTVTKLYVHAGDTVAAGTPIADILDRDTMKFTVSFHSVSAQTFSIGQGASVTVGGTAETLSGTISEIAAVDTVGAGNTRLRAVTITVPNPGTLSPSSTGTAAVGEVSSAATGTFSFNASKQLTATYSGKLESLTIHEGSAVTDGQVVGTFEERNFQDQIDAAAISLENAKLNRETAQAAVQDAETALKNARISLRDAQLAQQNVENNLDTARDNLEDFTITSPITGTVIEKNYKAGDNIDATATGYLCVIYDLSRLTFDMSVSELDVSRVAVGQSVTFTSDALEGVTFTGHVDKININGTTVSGTTNYPVTIVVDSGEGLYPGMNVSATILVEHLGRVLTVPVEAIQRPNLVYVAGPGALNDKGELVDPSKLEQREVTLGRNDSENIEILAGLEEGDTVYVPNASTSVMLQMLGQMGG